MKAPKASDDNPSPAAIKAERARDAAQAMRDYQAEQARIEANTARLRALRLAKEAAAKSESPEKSAGGKVRGAVGRKRS